MRKHLTLFATLLFAASCVNEELPNDDTPVDSNRVVFKATAAIQNESDAMAIKWEATKDKIGLFLSSGGEDICVNDYFYAFSSTQESSFIDYSDNLSLDHIKGKQVDLIAYYPYRSSVKEAACVPCSLDDKQKVTLDQLPDLKKNNVFYACQKDVVYGKDEHTMALRAAYSLVKVNMSFNRPVVCSKMLVSSDHADPLAFTSGNLDLNTGKITALEGAVSQIELSSDIEMSFQPEEAKDIYFLVAPGHAGGKFLLSFEHNGTDVEMELTLPQEGLVAGKVYSCSGYFDFSDIAFENLSANGTANTYIVGKPGKKYGFDPKVKGNGIERSFSWTFNGEPCQTSITDVQINPVDVKLLWYNNPDNTQISPIIPESVVYDTYLEKVFFDTPSEFVEGNAVLAAFNESGEIIWSWNIWAVENYNPDVTARTVGRFTVMDRNLGSFAGSEAAAMSAEDAAAAIGNYYQWGRKDPLPAAESFSPSGWGLKTYTPIADYQKAGGVIFTDNRTDNVYCIGKEIGSTFTLEQAVNASVANPHKSMANGTSDNQSPYNWLLPSYSSSEMMLTTADRVLWRTLWGSVDGYNNVKTIYDPCPPGWKVPTGDMYVYALGGAVSSANSLGYYSEKYDLFFPCAGQRQAGFGGSNLSGQGTALFYSSASVTDPYVPFSTNMTAYNSYAGAAYQVRCVKEEQPSKARPIGYQDGPVAVLMGDSITETWPTRGRKAFFTENDYVGVGISGQTTRDMLSRFYNDVLARNPQVIVVTGGSNDLAYNDGVNPCREDIKNNVMIMIEMAKAWGAEVIVGSTFPSRHYWWNYDGTTPKSFWPYSPEETAQRAIDLGTELKAYADANGYAYADYFSVLKDDENNLADEYCWSFGTSWAYAADGLDRVHPNAAGFLEMEKVLKPLVQSVLNDPNQVIPGGSSSDDFGKIEW